MSMLESGYVVKRINPELNQRYSTKKRETWKDGEGISAGNTGWVKSTDLHI